MVCKGEGGGRGSVLGGWGGGGRLVCVCVPGNFSRGYAPPNSIIVQKMTCFIKECTYKGKMDLINFLDKEISGSIIMQNDIWQSYVTFLGSFYMHVE